MPGPEVAVKARAPFQPAPITMPIEDSSSSAWTIAKASKTGITDSQSGFRFYSARLLRGVKLHTDGFDMESEVIVRAGCGGFQVVTTPIDLGFIDGVSTSHYKPLMDTLRIAWTVFRARLIWRNR